MDNLLDEILVEILHRLSCKQASRCKSVSKRWNSLIWSPHFLRRFINRQVQHFQSLQPQQQHCSFLLNPLETIMIPKISSPESLDLQMADHEFIKLFCDHEFTKLFSVSKKFPAGMSKVSGYSNGFLLWTCEDNHNRHWCYVFNIVTRLYTRLPQAPSGSTHMPTGFICQAMEEEDATTQRVKAAMMKFFVVFIRQIILRSSVEISMDVFSSETGCWEELSVSCQNQWVSYSLQYMSVGVPHNGKLYFYGFDGLLVYNPLKDVSRCYIISNPPDACKKKSNEYEWTFHRCFGVCCETLRLCEATHVSYGIVHIKVWELRGFDEETGIGFWHTVHAVCLGPTTWESNGSFCRFRSRLSEHRSLGSALLGGLASQPTLEIYLQAMHPCNGDILYISFRALFQNIYFPCDLKTESLEEIHVNNSDNRGPYCYFTTPILPPWWPCNPA